MVYTVRRRWHLCHRRDIKTLKKMRETMTSRHFFAPFQLLLIAILGTAGVALLVGQDSCTESENTEETCSDGLDNDNDTYIDCDDLDCTTMEVCGGSGDTEGDAQTCSDGLDNDGDGFTDCEDFDCENVASCQENTETKCSDGLDNDMDTYIDCDDWDCDFTVACGGTGEPEDNTQACQDGLDNDGDGYIDCEDRNCQDLTICR